MTGDKDGARHDPTELDNSAVATWGEQRGVIVPPVTSSVIPAGRSNLTFFVADHVGHQYVLRRPPENNSEPRAHDVVREWSFLKALNDTPVPTPRTIALCEDPNILGTPFYLMERVSGSPLTYETANGLNEAALQNLGPSIARTLALLHSLDIEPLGLGRFSRQTPFISRQVYGFSRQVKALKEKLDLGTYARLIGIGESLALHAPTAQCSALVHGDYKSENLMISDHGEVVAVLDWELAAIGDPLADLAWLLVWWGDMEPGQPWLKPPISTAPGIPPSQDIANAYAAASELDITDLQFYLAFAYWRLCAINAGTRARFAAGSMEGKVLDAETMAAQIDWQLRAAEQHLTKFVTAKKRAR